MRISRTSPVNQNMAYYDSRDRQKMIATLKLNGSPGLRDTQECFMDKIGGIQWMSRGFSPQNCHGATVQPIIH